MATKVLNYFSFDKTINKTFDKEITPSKPTPVRALPAKWYTSSEFYQLERRAIFSKQWLFLTHSVRLSNTGNWLRYQIAGYDVIITKDRKGAINAFHNVCRHRAYPVIEDEGSGNKKIIACRYHGWSYGLDGKLAKAPGYHGLEFEKEENGLLKVHTRIDRNGFVWINLDAKEIPEVPWEQQFENVDIQARYASSPNRACDHH